MHCPKCKTKNDPDDQFCIKCGAQLSKVNDQQGGLINKITKEGKMRRFLNFQIMVSSWVLKIIYILGAIVITLGGIILFFVVLFKGGIYILLSFAVLISIVICNLIWRVLCELWILFFSMHDSIVLIEESIRKS